MIKYMSMPGVILFFYCNPGGHFYRRVSEYIIFEEDFNCQYNMTATLFFWGKEKEIIDD